jgi:hypothetical protein
MYLNSFILFIRYYIYYMSILFFFDEQNEILIWDTIWYDMIWYDMIWWICLGFANFKQFYWYNAKESTNGWKRIARSECDEIVFHWWVFLFLFFITLSKVISLVLTPILSLPFSHINELLFWSTWCCDLGEKISQNQKEESDQNIGTSLQKETDPFAWPKQQRIQRQRNTILLFQGSVSHFLFLFLICVFFEILTKKNSIIFWIFLFGCCVVLNQREGVWESISFFFSFSHLQELWVNWIFRQRPPQMGHAKVHW